MMLCLLPLALWLSAEPPVPRFGNAFATLSSVAVAFALVGASAFALNLVLGARLRGIDVYFGGLDKLYRFHRRSGEVAFVLLLTHAALIAASRATISRATALGLFWPVPRWSITFGVIALTLGTATLLVTVFKRQSHEMFIYVHRLFGIAFLFATLHMLGTPGTPLPTEVKLYLAALAGGGLLSFAYRSLFGSVLVRRHDYVVAKINELDPTVVEITMEPVAEPLEFVPGQFVYVTFYSNTFAAQFHPVSIRSQGELAVVTVRPGDARDQFHPFSITSPPGERRLKVTVKAVGDFTRALHALDEGAAARIEGPYGRFSYLHSRNPAQVWIAGGIGVTPFLSMARGLEPTGRHIDLFYGFKDLDHAYFLEELAGIAQRKPGLRLIEVPEDSNGPISIDQVEKMTGDLGGKDIFLCGPPAMIESLRRQIRDRGVPDAQVHFERFSFGIKS